MSMVRLIKQDKELVEMIEKCCKKYGYNPMPFNFDQFASLDEYKKRVREFVEKEFK